MLKKLKKLLTNKHFAKNMSNSSWMLGEQILRIFSGVFVGIYVARYLGPENFGILSYSMAISVFLIAISRLGMDSILLREMVKTDVDKREQDRLLGTAIWLMMATSVTVYLLLIVGLVNVDEPLDIKIYIAIVCFSVICTPFLSIDFFYQSQLKSKIPALCKIATMGVMSFIKLILIYHEVDLFYFVLVALFDHVVLSAFLLFAIFKSKGLAFIGSFDKGLVRPLLKSSWLMVIASVAVIINMRIDQVMIKEIMGFEQAGIYSAAIKFYESWAVLPNTIAVSLLPAILKLKNQNIVLYHKHLGQLIGALFWLSACASLLVTFFAEPLMSITFGLAYADSASVVGIVMWASVFVAVGSVSARYFTIENMEKKILTRALVATVFNVLLNLIFIPTHGLHGAAITTLFCAVLSGYLMDWFDKDLKVLLKIKHKAIFLLN